MDKSSDMDISALMNGILFKDRNEYIDEIIQTIKETTEHIKNDKNYVKKLYERST